MGLFMCNRDRASFIEFGRLRESTERLVAQTIPKCQTIIPFHIVLWSEFASYSLPKGEAKWPIHWLPTKNLYMWHSVKLSCLIPGE